MDYTALIYHPTDIEDIPALKKVIRLFNADPSCRQIVLCCPGNTLLQLVHMPLPNVTLVRTAPQPYAALLSGLKAVIYDNVLVCDLSEDVSEQQKNAVKEALETYPAIFDGSLQAYDTRLLMHSLQQAIEQNLRVENYGDAVALLADTPVLSLETALQ